MYVYVGIDIDMDIDIVVANSIHNCSYRVLDRNLIILRMQRYGGFSIEFQHYLESQVACNYGLNSLS